MKWDLSLWRKEVRVTLRVMRAHDQFGQSQSRAHGDVSASRGAPVESRWQERVIELVRVLREPGTPESRNLPLGELWLLVNAAITMYVRIHRAHLGPIPDDDIPDLAAEKSLEVLSRNDVTVWNWAASVPQVASFLSSVSRNGLVDYLRKREAGPVALERAAAQGLAPARVAPSPPDPPDLGVDRLHFAQAIRNCALSLRPRARLIWFLRVFYDMSSRDIAAHPRVGMNAAAIDMAFSRSREAMHRCLQGKHLSADDLPGGTFTDLWELMRDDLVDYEGNA